MSDFFLFQLGLDGFDFFGLGDLGFGQFLFFVLGFDFFDRWSHSQLFRIIQGGGLQLEALRYAGVDGDSQVLRGRSGISPEAGCRRGDAENGGGGFFLSAALAAS